MPTGRTGPNGGEEPGGGARPPGDGAIYCGGGASPLVGEGKGKVPSLPAFWLSPSQLFTGYLCVSLLALAIWPNSTFRNPCLESMCLEWLETAGVRQWGSANVTSGDVTHGAHTAPGLGGNLGATVECRTVCCVATIGVEKEKL